MFVFTASSPPGSIEVAVWGTWSRPATTPDALSLK